MGRLLTRLSTIAMVLLVATPALAASAVGEVGTCLTESGLRMAPWSDPVDPACGEDCGAIDEIEETLCSTEDGTCALDAAVAARPTMPAPSGPRCLEAGPECSPDRSTAGSVPAGVVALAPPAPTAPRRIQGTLPGAGPPVTDAHPLDRDFAPPPRPPTA